MQRKPLTNDILLNKPNCIRFSGGYKSKEDIVSKLKEIALNVHRSVLETCKGSTKAKKYIERNGVSQMLATFAAPETEEVKLYIIKFDPNSKEYEMNQIEENLHIITPDGETTKKFSDLLGFFKSGYVEFI